MGVVVSRPCDRKKSQERGTGRCWRKKRKANADPSTSVGMTVLLFRRDMALFEEFFDEGVLGADQFADGAVEDQPTLFQHQECRVGVGLAFGEGDHVAEGGVEVVAAEGEGVLEAVGYEQGGYAEEVALLHDQLNDGGGGDGIEAAGGRVVEDELGLVDEGAGDGDAALHAAG